MIQNAIKITQPRRKPIYLVSVHTHHFNAHHFDTDTMIAVDGGPDYARRVRSDNLPDGVVVEEFCLNGDEHPTYIRNRLLWGTRGKDGTKPLTFKRLVDCSTSHLKAILTFPWTPAHPISLVHKKVIEGILRSRAKKS